MPLQPSYLFASRGLAVLDQDWWALDRPADSRLGCRNSRSPEKKMQ